VLRVYNELGRRDNLTKARIKILVRAVGVDQFRELVEAEWADLKNGVHKLPETELFRIKQSFVEPDWTVSKPLASEAVTLSGEALNRWNNWLVRNCLPNRHVGFVAVLIALKGKGRPPGDVTSAEMQIIADLADQFSQGFVRVTHAQNLVLPAVREEDLYALYCELEKLGLAHAVGGLVGDLVACPGGDFCALDNARSLPVADEIAARYSQLDAQEDIGPLDLRISGCMNSCGHHHTGHIGILGVDKDGAAFYQLLLGGHSGHGAPAALGTIIGRAFAEDEIADAVEQVLDTYLEQRSPGETFRETVARLGKAVFASAADVIRTQTVRREGSAPQEEEA
jgi:sulfite reductase (NADPH) hemoprotein beta-component